MMTGLPEIALGPLAGRPDADWYAAPPGKWCPAQIVEHLALSVERSGAKFEERRAAAPMVRRPRTLFERVAYLLIMRIGWIPSGFTAPKVTQPSGHPDRAATERRLRDGIARFERLEQLLLPARGNDVFVKHPRMGDLNFGEWVRFHERHFRHHARQIRQRLALAAGPR